MSAPSRDLTRSTGELVIRAFAKLSAVVALTVLGGFLMVAAAHGNDPSLFLVSFGRPALDSSMPPGYGSPHALGIVLTLASIGIGLSVLLIGAIGPREREDDPAELMDPFQVLSLP